MASTKILSAISLGLALHYNEIQQAWEVCGSDYLCKAEKFLLYFVGILGMASPSVLLSYVTKDLVNKAWMWTKGSTLIDKKSFWGMTFLGLGIYTTMEHHLSFVMDFMRYSTDCLKSGTCEGYDVLIWYCNKTDLAPRASTQLECAEDDLNCIEVDDEGIMGRIQDRSDWCVTFFNELPLLGSATFIGVSYLLSFGWQRDDEDDEDDEVENDGDNKSGDDTDSTREGKDKKSLPATALPREKKTKSQDKSVATQVVHVTCPFCKLTKRACFPKPLSIFCPDCGKNIKAKDSKDPQTQQTSAKAPNQKNSTPRNLFPSNNISNNITSTIPTPNRPYFKVDSLRLNVICQQEENSTACAFTNSESDSDISDDEEELYKTYMRLAIDHKDELKSSLYVRCTVCGYLHPDANKNGNECRVCGYLHADNVYGNGKCTLFKENSDNAHGNVCKVCGYLHGDHGTDDETSEHDSLYTSDDSDVYDDDEEEDFY